MLVDGAQAVPHLSVDVQDSRLRLLRILRSQGVWSTGIGVLYGKAALLEAMPPYQGGGDMISSVTFEKTTYNKVPYKFEAGTPDIAGAIGLHAALEYLNDLGMSNVAAHEHELLDYATETVAAIPGVRLIGTALEKAGVLSFVLEGVHPHDIGTILDQEGIAVRTGHHCAQPVMDRFGIPATARASFGLYNTREEIDALVQGIQKVRRYLPDGRSARPLSGSDSGAQQSSAELSSPGRKQTVEPRATTRSAATDFTVFLDVEGDSIRDIGFQGPGCAISKASASMMTQSLKGKTRAEAAHLFEQFHSLVTGRAKTNGDHSDLGKLTVFSGVSAFPARVKCATLAWHTLQTALEGKQEVVSTE